MPTVIEVKDSHTQLLIDFYVQRLKILRDEIIEREKETKEINSTIQKLKRKDISTPVSHADLTTENLGNTTNYSEKWPWVRKIHFALEHSKKPLTTKEIVDFLTEFESTFIFERKRAIASISSILSTKSGPNMDFIKFKSESGDNVYEIKKDVSNSKIEEVVDPLPF